MCLTKICACTTVHVNLFLGMSRSLKRQFSVYNKTKTTISRTHQYIYPMYDFHFPKTHLSANMYISYSSYISLKITFYFSQWDFGWWVNGKRGTRCWVHIYIFIHHIKDYQFEISHSPHISSSNLLSLQIH